MQIAFAATVLFIKRIILAEQNDPFMLTKHLTYKDNYSVIHYNSSLGISGHFLISHHSDPSYSPRSAQVPSSNQIVPYNS